MNTATRLISSRHKHAALAKHGLSVLLLIGQFVVYTFVWWSAPLNRMDFVAFYAATRLWQNGLNPYDLEAQCEIGRTIRDGRCLPMAHPPVLIPLMSVFIDDNYLASYWRWCSFLVCILALSLIPLYLICRDLTAALHAIVFTPIFISLFLGQDTFFVLLAVLLWAWYLSVKKDFLAGLGLSLALIKPHLAIPLALPLLFVRPKAFVGFLVGGLAFITISVLLVGPSGLKSLLNIMMVMAKGQGFGIDQERMCNVTGLLANAGLSTVWAWPIFLISIAGLCVLWRNTSQFALALGVVIAVFTAPHVHRQDLSLLVFPLVLIHPMAPMVAGGLMVLAFTQNVFRPSAYLLLLVLAVTLYKRTKRAQI